MSRSVSSPTTTPVPTAVPKAPSQAGAGPVGKWVRLRLVMVACFLCGLFGLVSVRAYVLQVRESDQYRAMAEEQYLREVELPAHRGRILDRIGTELAASAEVDSVYANPRLLREGDGVPQEALRGLSRALKMDKAELLRRLHSNRYFTWLKRRVAPDEARAARELNLAGVGLLREPKRYYPNRGLAGPVLGWAGMDAVGQEGVELAYDRWLRGSRAAIPGLQDARRQTILVDGIGDLSRDNGHDVYLTLDKFIQFRLEQALEEGVLAAKARAGVAVALDPRTGEILAMASVPSVNPNDPGNARERGVRNRAVTDPFEPGSTLKPFSIGAGVEAGVIRPDQEWDCEGGKWKIGKATIHDAHPEGSLTTTQVLARSSNICTAKISRRTGRDTVSKFLRKLGFAAPTGVDLPGERAGQLRPVAQWGDVAFATISFGQGMTATPLQLAAAVAAYANGGVLYRPHILGKVVDAKGKIVLEPSQPPEGHRVISEQVARTMREMMRAVMLKKGTGEALDIPGYPVAGKTGTAQKVDPATRRYSPDHWASSFMGFAPYDDPRLVLFVMVDEPQGTHYGGAVAGPIFVKVMSAALPYLGIAPRKSDREARSAAVTERDRPGASTPAAAQQAAETERAASADVMEDVEAEQQDDEDEAGGRAEVKDRVPDFRGMGLGDALQAAQRASLRLLVSGSGRVMSQVPQAGSVRKGPACEVRLAPPQ